VTTNQASGIDFAIDTVKFSVPEASNTLTLMAMALVGLGMLRWKRTHRLRSVV